MKTKFPLYKRLMSRHHATGAPSHGAFGSAVALVDERYMIWLAEQVNGVKPAALQRAPLASVLAHLVRLAGAEVPLSRTLLFTDAAPTELFDDVVVRLVPPHASDGGLELVRAMGQAMIRLAQYGSGWLFVASDDERLFPYIDEAQMRGARVVLVADDAAQDYARVAADDPSWARLLMQADRRVAVPAAAWDALTTPGVDYYPPHVKQTEVEDADGLPLLAVSAQTEPDDHWRAQVARIIQDWWADESADDRANLADTMRNRQAIPPETDRRLLTQLRRELGRNLTAAEKRVMREMVRSAVLGEAQAALADATPH